ncbi:hypothetical protein FXO38_27232 [Capsicum annuum]|nr:hypothetical protein FXO38_27232 [Capsicum annuum]
MSDMHQWYVEKYVDEILYFMRGRQLAYPKVFYATDRIMDLNFYNNFKDRYTDLIKLVSTPSGPRFDLLVFGFEWDKDMINYAKEKNPYRHSKDWTKARRILVVMNVVKKHFLVVEMLLEKGMMNVYDCNFPAFNEAYFFYQDTAISRIIPQLIEAKWIDESFACKTNEANMGF